MATTQSSVMAGPSNYARRPHPGRTAASTSQIPTPVSPSTDTVYVQALHDFDPSLLPSINKANLNLYVSFKSGEVIRVRARDNTGWWDGEVTSSADKTGRPKVRPRRGWFPSNYVRIMTDVSIPRCVQRVTAADSSPNMGAHSLTLHLVKLPLHTFPQTCRDPGPRHPRLATNFRA